MKILVAGGGGFIGSALVPELLDHGYEVVVIDLFWFGNHLPEGVRVVKKDLFDCEKEDFEGFDQVIFLAGLSNDPMAEYSPSKNFVYNGALPSYLAYIAKLAGIKRFIYASSCSVYGYTIDKLYDETSPAVSAYPYGISKLQGEFGALQMADENFSVISLRQGTVCGHSPRMRFDLIVNTMFRAALNEGKITVNNPSIWRPILSINDAVRAYLRAVQANYGVGGVFNVASDNYTVGQVGDNVRDDMTRLTGTKIQIELLNKQDYRNYKVSFNKAKTYLGYMPKENVTDIIRGMYNHLDAYGDLSNEAYYNIQVFKNIENQRSNSD
ncbi:MAG: SDR family oxidoreductase [Desulfobacterales bacterium]|nr:SDR family oxidoreductase [Desulfobacterales bacterium]